MANYDARNVDVTKGGVRWPYNPGLHELEYSLRVDDEQWEKLLEQVKEKGFEFNYKGKPITEVVVIVLTPGYIIPNQEFASEKTELGQMLDFSKNFVKRVRVVYLKKAPND